MLFGGLSCTCARVGCERRGLGRGCAFNGCTSVRPGVGLCCSTGLGVHIAPWVDRQVHLPDELSEQQRGFPQMPL